MFTGMPSVFGQLSSLDSSTPPPLTVDSDPYWANVQSLMYFYGANGNTNVVDETGLLWTAGAGTEIYTGVKLFGLPVLEPVGTGLLMNTGIPTAIGTGDFTFECFVYGTTTPVAGTLFYTTSYGSPTLQINAGILQFSDSFAWHYSANNNGITIPQNQFTHIAVSRVSGTMYLFIGGTLVFTFPCTTGFAGKVIRIGSNGGSALFGYMAQSRITIGVGRYTTSFTPPTSRFPNHG